MPNRIMVSTYAVVEGCAMDVSAVGSAQAEITRGHPRDGFQFVIDVEALRKLIKLGAETLAEMDAQYEREEAERSSAGLS